MEKSCRHHGAQKGYRSDHYWSRSPRAESRISRYSPTTAAKSEDDSKNRVSRVSSLLFSIVDKYFGGKTVLSLLKAVDTRRSEQKIIEAKVQSSSCRDDSFIPNFIRQKFSTPWSNGTAWVHSTASLLRCCCVTIMNRHCSRDVTASSRTYSTFHRSNINRAGFSSFELTYWNLCRFYERLFDLFFT
jgi:hypothetical protein